MLKVKVLVSFNGLVKGMTGTVDGDDSITRARAYAGAGLLEVLDGGTDQSGSGAAPAGDPWRKPEGAGEHGAPGGEQGEDPLSG